MVARQCLIVLLPKTQLEQSTLANLLGSIAVCVKDILTLGDRDVTDGNTCMKLMAALVRMSNFDKASEDISLPCLVQWMVEVFDVPLEQPQLSLEADDVGLHLCKLSLDAVVGSFQSQLGGVEFLKPLGVSFNIHDKEHTRGWCEGGGCMCVWGMYQNVIVILGPRCLGRKHRCILEQRDRTCATSVGAKSLARWDSQFAAHDGQAKDNE